jgi:hypothetical protein
MLRLGWFSIITPDWLNAVADEMTILLQNIRALLDAPSGPAGPSLARLEHTLTDGYARALSIEAERMRLERRLASAAVELGQDGSEAAAAELARLGHELSTADGDLTLLRALLSSLKIRARDARAA